MNRRHAIAANALLVLSPLIAQLVCAQAPAAAPVVWSASAEAVAAQGNERRYRLTLTGNIAGGYIVYGSDFKAELGPNPTRLRFDASQPVTTIDALQSSGTRKGHDKELKVDYTYFEKQALLTQVVTVAPNATKIVGTVVGQTCHEADGTCELFRSRFEVPLEKAAAK